MPSPRRVARTPGPAGGNQSPGHGQNSPGRVCPVPGALTAREVAGGRWPETRARGARLQPAGRPWPSGDPLSGGALGGRPAVLPDTEASLERWSWGRGPPATLSGCGVDFAAGSTRGPWGCLPSGPSWGRGCPVFAQLGPAGSSRRFANKSWAGEEASGPSPRPRAPRRRGARGLPHTPPVHAGRGRAEGEGQPGAGRPLGLGARETGGRGGRPGGRRTLGVGGGRGLPFARTPGWNSRTFSVPPKAALPRRRSHGTEAAHCRVNPRRPAGTFEREGDLFNDRWGTAGVTQGAPAQQD